MNRLCTPAALVLLSACAAQGGGNLEFVYRSRMRSLAEGKLAMLEPVIQDVYKEIVAVLKPVDAKIARGVRLEFKRTGGAMDFWAISERMAGVAGANRITVSEPALRSVELLVLAALMGDQMSDPGFVGDYIGYIRGCLRGGRPGMDPLAATGWCYDDLAALTVEKYIHVTVSVFAFILAHEVAHIVLPHDGNSADSSAELARSRREEAEADRFACDVLLSLKAAPVSACMIMSMWAMATESGVVSTHPPGAERCRALAGYAISKFEQYSWAVPDGWNPIDLKGAREVLQNLSNIKLGAEEFATLDKAADLGDGARLVRPRPPRAAERELLWAEKAKGGRVVHVVAEDSLALDAVAVAVNGQHLQPNASKRGFACVVPAGDVTVNVRLRYRIPLANGAPGLAKAKEFEEEIELGDEPVIVVRIKRGGMIKMLVDAVESDREGEAMRLLEGVRGW